MSFVYNKYNLSFAKIFPSLLTIASACLGLSAIKQAWNYNFSLAIIYLLIAGALDGLDGRTARLLKSTSKFGELLDSLSDFISFGVAPAFVLYFWSLEYSSFGWSCVLIYSICCALRLARFHSLLGSKKTNEYDLYTGVAAPSGAALSLFPIILFNSFEFASFTKSAIISGLWLIFVAALMISTIQTVSIKTLLKIKWFSAIFVLITILWIISLFEFRWYAFTFYCVVYLALLPIAYILKYFKLAKL